MLAAAGAALGAVAAGAVDGVVVAAGAAEVPDDSELGFVDE